MLSSVLLLASHGDSFDIHTQIVDLAVHSTLLQKLTMQFPSSQRMGSGLTPSRSLIGEFAPQGVSYPTWSRSFEGPQ